jgi:hypothetical protein
VAADSFGASMIARDGSRRKMVIYPIRDNIDGQGRQLVNWVAELETPKHTHRDWNRLGSIDDFIGAFDAWHFDWLDVPQFLRSAETIWSFRWSTRIRCRGGRRLG